MQVNKYSIAFALLAAVTVGVHAQSQAQSGCDAIAQAAAAGQAREEARSTSDEADTHNLAYQAKRCLTQALSTATQMIPGAPSISGAVAQTIEQQLANRACQIVSTEVYQAVGNAGRAIGPMNGALNQAMNGNVLGGTASIPGIAPPGVPQSVSNSSSGGGPSIWQRLACAFSSCPKP